MSDSDRIAHIRALNRARAKTYYLKHKEAIAQQRKDARQACREALADNPAQEPAPAPAPAKPRLRVKRPVPAKEEKSEPAPAPVKPRLRVKRPVTAEQKEAKKKALSYEQAVKVIDESPAILSDGSRAIYRNHLKSVVEILQCQDIIPCFQNAPEVIQKLNDAKQKRDSSKGYSLNSKKSYVQMILKLSDVLAIPLTTETKQQYIDAFDELKLDSKEQTKSRQEEAKESKEEPLTFTTYLPKVSEKFGKDSTEYLIASLYSVHGFRDNLQLRIVQVPDDKGDNQLILPEKRGAPYQIHLAKYKTGKKYGVKTISLPNDISKLVRGYLAKNKRKIGDSLFGSQKLSGFIGKFNKELGLPVTINTYREMLVAPVIDDMDSKQRVELARKMGHSPATSEHYKRKKK